MNRTVHPVEFSEIAPDERLVFLAGPIRGARNWRIEAQSLVASLSEDRKIVFANPDRLNGEKRFTPGHENFVDRQRQWEQYYLRKAVELSKEGRGAVLFWLEKQTVELPEEAGIQKKAYGAISHLELGELLATHPDSLAVGIHPQYNERTVLENDLRQSGYLDLSQPYDPKRLSEYPISETLEETCARVCALIR